MSRKERRMQGKLRKWGLPVGEKEDSVLGGNRAKSGTPNKSLQVSYHTTGSSLPTPHNWVWPALHNWTQQLALCKVARIFPERSGGGGEEKLKTEANKLAGWWEGEKFYT